jgi:hypothetical protein
MFRRSNESAVRSRIFHEQNTNGQWNAFQRGHAPDDVPQKIAKNRANTC